MPGAGFSAHRDPDEAVDVQLHQRRRQPQVVQVHLVVPLEMWVLARRAQPQLRQTRQPRQRCNEVPPQIVQQVQAVDLLLTQCALSSCEHADR